MAQDRAATGRLGRGSTRQRSGSGRRGSGASRLRISYTTAVGRFRALKTLEAGPSTPIRVGGYPGVAFRAKISGDHALLPGIAPGTRRCPNSPGGQQIFLNVRGTTLLLRIEVFALATGNAAVACSCERFDSRVSANVLARTERSGPYHLLAPSARRGREHAREFVVVSRAGSGRRASPSSRAARQPHRLTPSTIQAVGSRTLCKAAGLRAWTSAQVADTFCGGSRLTQRQDESTYAASGVGGVRVHGTHTRRVDSRLEQLAVCDPASDFLRIGSRDGSSRRTRLCRRSTQRRCTSRRRSVPCLSP